MAICFSSLMAQLYLASAVVSLAACSMADNGSFRRAECPVAYGRGSGGGGEGPSKAEGDAVVVLWLRSMVGYAVHLAMVWKVRWVLKMRARKEMEGQERGMVGVVALESMTVDLEAKARMEQEARDRWGRIGGL